MKKNAIIFRLIAILAIVATIFCFAGCDTESGVGGALKLLSFTIDRSSIKTNYLVGEEVDFSGIRATAKYSDETLNKVYTFAELTVTYDADITATVGEKEVVVSFDDPNLNVKQEARITIKVTEEVVADVPQIVVQFEKSSTFVSFDSDNRNAGQAAYGEAAFPGQFAIGGKTYVIGNENVFQFNPDFAVINEDDEVVDLKNFYAVVEISLEKDGSFVKLTKTAAEGNSYTYYDGETLIATVDTYRGNYQFSNDAAGAKIKIEVLPSEEHYIFDDFKAVSLEAEIIQAYNVYEAWQLAVVDNDTTRTDWVDFKTEFGLNNLNVSGIVLHNDIKITSNDVPASFFYTSEKDVIYKNATTGETKTIPAGTLFLKDETFVYQRKGIADFVIQGNLFNLDVSGFPLIPSPEVFGANAAKDYGSDFSNASLFRFESVEWEVVLQNPTEVDRANVLIENLSIIGNAKRDNLVDSGENLVSAGGLIFIKSSHYTKTTMNNVIGNSYFITYFVDYGAELYANSVKCYDSYQNAAFSHGNTILTFNDSYLNGCGGPVILSQCVIDRDWKPVNIVNNTITETHVTGGEIWFVAVKATTLVSQMHALGAGLEAAGLGNFVDANGKMNMQGILLAKGDNADEVITGLAAQGSMTFDNHGANRFHDNETWSAIYNHPAFVQGAAFLTVYDAEGNAHTVYNIGTPELYDMYGRVVGTDASHAALVEVFKNADCLTLSQGGFSIVFEFYHK